MMKRLTQTAHSFAKASLNMQAHSLPNTNTAKDPHGMSRFFGRMAATLGNHSTSWLRMIPSLVHNMLKTMFA